ncbi:unnamed protein product [Miscanthus lutarioriparius]|uniref:NB-ARC domain-containing protein n=1 Tax=Miscanthus lutarioriparius TaxID=422564 RepID=A0A811NI88_9POAL|nr:unnamed protein product [Miscanthus lutarioriparius]
MVSLMEIFLSAILGDLTTRCIDFLASKRPNKAPALDDVEDRLRRVLLRALVIVDEAMGRRITNQAMLRQLDALTDTVHRGYYALDTFRSFQQAEKEEPRPSSNGQTTIVSHRLSSHFSRVDPCLSSWTSRAVQISKEMQEVLDTLSAMIVDAHELVLFLANYGRPMYRQPYSMYLLLGNCMFGRQIEAQIVIDFLLYAQHSGAEEPAVLPIVGPFRVGKSTLVAHVCKDERVRGHFSETVFLSDHDFLYDGLAAFREGLCAMRQQDCGTSDYSSNKDGATRRLLLVVEVGGDLDEDVWNRLYSASKHWMPRGSKIILTSRSDKIAKLGTTQALNLKPLSHEAYWYFFRTLAFGSADPMSHPRQLTNLAMEIAATLNGGMIIANVSARMLRDSFSVQFWRKVATFMRSQFQRHASKFGEHPYDLISQNKPVYFERMRSEQMICYHQYRHSSQKEVPKITWHEVINGDAKLPAGRFQVLSWISQIPPYYSYIYDCEIQELKSIGNKRKRSAKNGSAPSICL